MKVRNLVGKCLAGAFAALLVFPAHATIVGVSNVADLSGLLIPAPANALDNLIGDNSHQLGFDERQGVVLAAALTVTGSPGGGTSIAAGTRVDSHMILLNRATGSSLIEANNIWEFSGEVLGWMSDVNGVDEGNSESILGLLTTNYAQYSNRGLESGTNNDFIATTANPNELQVFMRVTQPGDWIRVVTRTVPEPATVAMLGFGLLGIGFAGRRKKG